MLYLQIITTIMRYYPHFLDQKKYLERSGNLPKAKQRSQNQAGVSALLLLVCGLTCKMSITSTFRIVTGSSQIMCLINTVGAQWLPAIITEAIWVDKPGGSWTRGREP